MMARHIFWVALCTLCVAINARLAIFYLRREADTAAAASLGALGFSLLAAGANLWATLDGAPQ